MSNPLFDAAREIVHPNTEQHLIDHLTAAWRTVLPADMGQAVVIDNPADVLFLMVMLASGDTLDSELHGGGDERHSQAFAALERLRFQLGMSPCESFENALNWLANVMEHSQQRALLLLNAPLN